MTQSGKTIIEMRRWWVSELKAITAREMAKEEKRQEKLIKKSANLMGEYEGWTYNDFQEAYGCGAITEKQFDRFCRILEGMKPEPGDLYMAKIQLLEELYQEQKEVLRELEASVEHTENA